MSDFFRFRSATMVVLLSLANFAGIAQEEPAGDKKADEGDISDFDGIFKIKNWDKDLKLPEVKDDAKNVLREPYHPDELAKIAESTGLAAKIAVAEKLKWQPAWKYEGVGGVTLPSIAISDDRSLLAIVETTGEMNGPNGSRLVIVRVTDWLVLRIHTLKTKKVHKALFLTDSTELLLSASRQPELKENNEIIIVDGGSGATIKSKKIKNRVKDFVVLGSRIVACLEADAQKGGSELYEMDADSLQMKTGYKTENKDGILAPHSPADGKFIFAGDRNVEIFSISQNEPLAKFAGAESKVPSAALALPGDDLVFATYAGGGAYLFRGERPRKLLDMADSSLIFDHAGGLLVASSIKKDSAVLFKLPGLDESESFSMSSLKPKTSGDVIFSAVLTKQSYVFADSHGNFFTCTKKGKKWKKELGIAAMK